mmetsp:Transcript_108792/g.318292  ORF Transcript_108792/g.318292 Transcript_108792/m.318292 type:complete len:363 (-) Transcript_108792:106-1194(-)
MVTRPSCRVEGAEAGHANLWIVRRSRRLDTRCHVSVMANHVLKLDEIRGVLFKDAAEVWVRQPWTQWGPALEHLGLPPVLEQRRVATPYLKGKCVGRLHVAIRPIYRCAGASIANLVACSAVWTPAMASVNGLQDLQHGPLLLCQVQLHLVCPGHIQATSPAVNTQEESRLVLLDNSPHDPGLWLTEGTWATIATGGGLGRPLLVPVAVEVHTLRVQSPAVVSLLNQCARPGARVEDHLKVTVLQDLLCTVVPYELHLATERPQKVQHAFGADQLACVLPGHEKDAVSRRGFSTSACPFHTHDINAHARLLHSSDRHGHPAALCQAMNLRLRVVIDVIVGELQSQSHSGTAVGERPLLWKCI